MKKVHFLLVTITGLVLSLNCSPSKKIKEDSRQQNNNCLPYEKATHIYQLLINAYELEQKAYDKCTQSECIAVRIINTVRQAQKNNSKKETDRLKEEIIDLIGIWEIYNEESAFLHKRATDTFASAQKRILELERKDDFSDSVMFKTTE